MLVKKDIGRSLKHGIVKYAPHILTGLGIAGVYVTAIFASRATLKAAHILEAKHTERYLLQQETPDILQPDFTKKEILSWTWKEYIPAMLASLATCACVIKSGRIHAKRHAALMALYSLTETALREYQGKVKEIIGDGKETKIRDSVAKDRIDRRPANEIIVTGSGETLCFDAPSGRYFQSNIETIRRIENVFNRTLRTEMSMTLNDLYSELGVPEVKTGDYLGWEIDKGLLTFRFSSQLNEHGMPCLVVDYEIYPLYGR